MTSAELDNFLLLIILALIVVSITVYLWKKMWVNYSIMMLPRSVSADRTIDIRNSVEHNRRKVISEVINILWNFSPEYLVKFIGLDAYSYIAFLRCGVKISYYLAFFSIISILFFQYTLGRNNFVFAITTTKENWGYIGQCVTTTVVVLIVLIHLHFLKLEIKEAAKLKIHNEGSPNFEVMKIFTVKVTSQFDSIDTNGEPQIGTSGILELQEIPYIGGLEHLLELRECNYQLGCIEKAKAKGKTFICLRLRKKEKKLNDRVAVLVKLIETSREKIESAPAPNSFISFASQKDLCTFGRNHMGPKEEGRCMSFIRSLWAVLKRNKGQMGPAFQDILFAQDKIINYKRFPEPLEILWKNFCVNSKGRRLRKFLVNMLVMVIFIFLTTPAALISLLDSFVFNELRPDSKGETSEKGSWIGQASKILSSVLLISINALLLLLIDYSVYVERLPKVSSIQKAIYDKAIIYLLLNNLFVPCLVQTSGSVYVILTQNKNIGELFMQIVLLNDFRVFYTSLILQSAIFSFAFVILRVPEIFSSLGNPILAHYKRLDLLKYAWTRQEVDLFQFGFFYANAVTMTIIAIIYTSSLPFLALGLFIFFCLRLFSDTYILLTNHRIESESLGELVAKAISGVCFGCIIFQIIAISNLFFYGRYEGIYAFAFMLICLPFYQMLSRNDIFEYANIKFDHENENNAIYQWSYAYRHPVNISNRCSIAMPIR